MITLGSVTSVGPGFDVIMAGDGLDGLQKVRSTPDLAAVVVDLNMPLGKRTGDAGSGKG